jgi:hypothetical protein
MTDNEAMPWKPLFWTDPERFTKNMLNQDDAARFRQYKDARDVLFGEISRYGFHFNRPEWITPLRRMYDDLVSNGMSVEQRGEVLQCISTMVENTKSMTVNAFLPFICQDPDRGIVSTASVDYVSFGPLLDNDPMAFPKELIQLIEDGEVRNAGAVFGAMLVLGDPRLCKLLWPLKDQLSYEEANEAAQCTSGFVSAATIDFVLDWMEGLDGAAEDALFGSLASHLGLQRRHMQVPFVATGLRPFPVTSVTPDEYRAMRKWIPVEDYVANLAPRLLALAQAEPEPKAMPLILREWGIAAPTLNN